MLPPNYTIVDISLELDSKNFAMRTPAGFTRDMQFAMEVLKEHDAPGGAGQIVRGVHMRLHAVLVRILAYWLKTNEILTSQNHITLNTPNLCITLRTQTLTVHSDMTTQDLSL